MKEENRIKITPFKIIMFAIVITIISYAIYYLFPVIKNITTEEGRIEFKNIIMNSGVAGVAMLFGLQIAQMFLLILPAEPLEIFAGMCFGAVWGTIFILISVFITSTMVFFLVRRFKKKFIYAFFPKEKVDKIEKSKILNNPKKVEMILSILFFIPGTPKALIVYFGGLLPIKPLNFILIATFARFPSIISSTLVGSNIMNGNWTNILIIYILTFILAAIIYLIINLFDKNKETEQVLDEIR